MTLGRLRQLVGRTGRRVGPVLVTAVAAATAGLGFHAALDWHRHGEPGTGFFHLHVHFGDHVHPDDPRAGGAREPFADDADRRPEVARHHDHDHAPDHRHPEGAAPGEPSQSGSEPSGNRRHVGVLSLALGVAPAPVTATVAGPALEPGERACTEARRIADRPVELCAWSPRGPPA